MKMRVWALAMACVLGCAAMTGCGSAREQNTHSLGADKPFGEVKRETEAVQTSSAVKETTESVVPEETVPTEKMTYATLVTEEEKDFLDSIMDVVDEKLDEKLEKSADGIYVDMRGLQNRNEEYKQNVDQAVKAVLEEASSQERGEYCQKIILDQGGFRMNDGIQAQSMLYYSGEYSIEDDIIRFRYQQCEKPDGTVISADDADATDRSAKAIQEKMNELTRTSSYLRLSFPQMYGIDRYYDYGMYPQFYDRAFLSNNEIPSILEYHGDFICMETYGFTLENGYRSGDGFKICFSPYDVILDDSYSRYYTQQWDEKQLEKVASVWEQQLFLDGSIEDERTEITFSDGTWEWYNSEGDLINNGAYQESMDYPGLIMMTITEESVKAPKAGEKESGVWLSYSQCMPLLFYIAEDGEIYYPGFVRAE